MSALPAAPLIVPAEIAAMLSAQVPVAVGVSGGKDSVACALAVSAYLDARGHTGPRILVHSDLGMVEWVDSLPSCERLHQHLCATSREPWEFATVRRKAGGMMERWESRWASSVRRYQALECVRVILPWSTPSMRFCTSELKNDPITSFLKRRFGNQPIISATGIRAEESTDRARRAPAKRNPKLHAGGLDWHAILHWLLADVFAQIEASGLSRHEAYLRFNASRVSCVFCIMSALADLLAALADERNHPVFVRMADLEILSGFAFQERQWLSELRADLVDPARLIAAKRLAAKRVAIESRIPRHLAFEKGWPNFLPSPAEAAILATVRAEIAALYGWPATFATADAVRARYADLIAQKRARA